ncbi:probable RNA helicase armi isoform X2 [Cephus cinctus]|uniref:RNA helicase n=1 Tax=Cephus cinctus TaxID=211228 RepID=A0AAJ7BK88_CEPCN|nr:probable RNA helicase armi isoform X2 [Cephus cinctus]
MLSFIASAAQYVLGYGKSTEPDINEIISRIESADDTKSLENQRLENENQEGFFYKNGRVTTITGEYVIIDDHYICETVNITVSNLEVGDTVHYLAFQRHQNEEQKIRKIISLTNETWDDQPSDREIQVKDALDHKVVKVETLKRSVVGKVTKREGRTMFIEPINITVHLDKVASEFVPIVGDWLMLESLVEVDERSTDLGGEVLEVDRINPLRTKLVVGHVTAYSTTIGIGKIDNSIIFNKISCEPGYVPCIGDKVVSDSIESDQGICTWRSLTVVPLVQVAQREPVTTQQNEPLLCSHNVQDLDAILKDKRGIIITSNLTFDLQVNEEQDLEVLIENTGRIPHILYRGCFMSKKAQSQLSLISPTVSTVSTLNPLEKISYKFRCKARFMGLSEELFIFSFRGFKIGRVFRISVRAKNCGNRNTGQKFESFNRLARQNEIDQNMYICGIRPIKPAAFITVRNGIFKIPQKIWNAVLGPLNERQSQMDRQIAVGDAVPCLLNGLTFENYRERFHALLYLEEVGQRIDLQKYDMNSVVMRHCGEFLALKVPGLAEKRPSLLIGDKAIISFKWDSSGGELKYEGCIHKVNSSEILLKFNPKFHDEYNGADCYVTFSCSMTSLTRCHMAVNLAVTHLGPEFLFPNRIAQKAPQVDLEENEIEDKPKRIRCRHERSQSTSSICSKKKYLDKSVSPNDDSSKSIIMTSDNGSDPVDIKDSHSKEINSYVSQFKKRKLIWFNKKLNYYQKEAVRNIIKGVARPLPYVIFGPPGTGKTITLCETALQIYAILPESRFLIATPSNSSANLIAERLLDSGVLKPGDLVRLVAHHCLYDESIPEKLLPYCATAELAAERSRATVEYCGEGPRLNCTSSVLGRHRITVGTCISLGILYNMGFPRGHFSHVLVDEAGQATEPEIMVPLNFIHSSHGQVVLAGDPMQLGPVIQNKLAEYYGYGESFLSRLLHRFPYQKDPESFDTGYDPRLVTKLVMNYRSLSEILELPNSLFYDSELRAQISSKRSKEVDLLKSLANELPERTGVPPAIVFHGVRGENYQDTDSPSWYNPEEATQVYLYLLRLYNHGLGASDIGIITPYQKQVRQIRELLFELDLVLPKVGSVEEFQGQERNVIILSTVRSTSNLVPEDIKHAIGFIASPRRLNVAITRARALLIILGNPDLLSKDPYWRSVLIYCIEHGGYTGCEFLSSAWTNALNESDDDLCE